VWGKREVVYAKDALSIREKLAAVMALAAVGQ
jgi:hypothetical protein